MNYGKQLEEENEQLKAENAILRSFIYRLGIAPDLLIAAMSDATNGVCKELALKSLKLHWDWAQTTFTESGINASNAWLDSLKF